MAEEEMGSAVLLWKYKKKRKIAGS